MTRKTAIFALSLMTACLVPRISFATPVPVPVTLTVEPSTGSPYEIQIVNGKSTTLADLSCLNDQRSVYVGESWTADAINLGALTSNSSYSQSTVIGNMTLGQLEVDAFLESKYTSSTGSTTNTEIQDAIWSVLDGKNDYTGLSGSTQDTAVQSYITAAEAAVASTKNTSSFYNEFTFYYPQTWGTKDSEPQQFLGMTTPEPSSLILLGTGIVGLAGAMRRRFMASNQA